jgi:hypothetical protein
MAGGWHLLSPLAASSLCQTIELSGKQQKTLFPLNSIVRCFQFILTVMTTDRDKARLRGLVQRTETRAKRLIHSQVEPFRDYEWIEEISVYDKEGKLLERYSPDNQVMEQESIRQLFIYDEDGKLIEKQGYGEDNSAEDSTKYFYDDDGKMTESIYTNFQGFSKHHIFYDERENPKIVNTYDGKDGSLRFVQKMNYIYKESGNKLAIPSPN